MELVLLTALEILLLGTHIEKLVVYHCFLSQTHQTNMIGTRETWLQVRANLSGLRWEGWDALYALG